MAALAGCFYLMVLTVLLLVAHLVGAVRLARSLTAIAPKVIRRALAPFAVFSLTIASAAASAHASGPSTPPPAVLMLELNGPALASMVLVTEPKPTTRTHIVSSGEHFWSIAELELRSSLGREPKSQEIEAYWKRLIDANRDRLRVRDNADLIYVGQQLVLP